MTGDICVLSFDTNALVVKCRLSLVQGCPPQTQRSRSKRWTRLSTSPTSPRRSATDSTGIVSERMGVALMHSQIGLTWRTSADG
jgi:hypothetical protein